MIKKIFNNVVKYKYDWLSVLFLLLGVISGNFTFFPLFFLTVMISEFKKH
jgi:hypothetical protein